MKETRVEESLRRCAPPVLQLHLDREAKAITLDHDVDTRDVLFFRFPLRAGNACYGSPTLWSCTEG